MDKSIDFSLPGNLLPHRALIDARFNAIAEEKQKLIAQLRRQLTHAELDAALDLAKYAQKRWQTLGKGSQKTDQALWQELRELIDPRFEKRNDQLKAVDAQRDAGRAAAQALIDELGALPAGELDSTRLEAEIVRIENLWRGDAERPRDLERAFDQATAQAQAAVVERRHGESTKRQNKVGELAAEIDRIEANVADADDALLAELEARARTLDSAVSAAFAGRLLRLRQTDAAARERHSCRAARTRRTPDPGIRIPRRRRVARFVTVRTPELSPG